MGRRIDGMVVVITGASAGIGRAVAEELGPRGARLVLAARRLERLEELNAKLGGGHLCVRCNVSETGQCRELIEAAVGRFGRIDTLVCNAGYGVVRTIADTSPAEMRRIFSTNVFGTTDCIHFALPIMARQEPRDGWRGQVMIVSSAAGRRGLPYFGPYSATKAAQLGLAEGLRVECRPLRIAVTSVHPIGTDTEFFDVAQREAGAWMPGVFSRGIHQSARRVAREMVRGIASPVPEVWPARAARWLVSLGTLMPGVVDRVMGRFRTELEREVKPSSS
ncbi:MAG TPA: SDR family NAD(P)-dependent oxidoreductase [Tepidisphaeraceae bacterium]|jgi:NAD(P)-dependent dehydrogenase (short-subunit alcohol dehydrogenase family)